MTRCWLAFALAVSLVGCTYYTTRHVTQRPPPPAVWEDVTPDAGR
jgi:hypothetical protein